MVVGAGLAGLSAALEAAGHRNVVVVCKGTLEDSNTWKAQGGIASVLTAEDTFEAHVADTLKTGCGLCDQSVVGQVVKQGPQLIKQVAASGARPSISSTGRSMPRSKVAIRTPALSTPTATRPGGPSPRR